MVIKLKKPVTVNGQEYKELDADFEKLTGADLMKARAGLDPMEFNVDNFVPALSMEYQAQVSALAASVPFEVIKALPAQDFMHLTKTAQSFLLG